MGFFTSRHPGEIIWVHAVSAGETIAAVPLIQRLLASGNRLLVTNMTPTGRDRVKALLGDSVENCYAPYDLPGSVMRFLKKNRPTMLIVIDTELWPNTIHLCKKEGVRVVVVNGRMSERSAKGYKRIDAISRPMMKSLDLVAAQTKQHAERFAALGVPETSLHVTGSIKFDGEASEGHETRLANARRLTSRRPVLLGASTHEGEERALIAVLPALQSVVPDVLLVLAPRHTHRCDAVARTCESQGYEPVRFSQTDKVPEDCRVLLIDVMGQLETFYHVSRLAFVGGSLVPVGGHNFLEAVRAETPVVMGCHLDNIEDIAAQFIDRDAMQVVKDNSGLRDEVIGFMRDEGKAQRLAKEARAVLEMNRGALDRVEALITRHESAMARILFLCTGNSCRSQMAEGWARHFSPKDQIMSAGIEAHGLNPFAVQVMSEAGVDISRQESTLLSEYSLDEFDMIVTVCGDADEKCPVLPKGVRKEHWPLEDPASIEGGEEVKLEGFRAIRDEIRDRVGKLLG